MISNRIDVIKIFESEGYNIITPEKESDKISAADG
jgi:hypothetical protein